MPQPNRLAALSSLARIIAAGLAISLLSGCANQDLQNLLDPLKQGWSKLDETLRSAGNTAAAPSPDGDAPPQTAAVPPAAAAPEKAAAASAKPVAPPTNPASVPVAESATQPPAQSASLPRPAPALRNTSELVGLDSTTVEQRLGTPALRRRDAPAELWQYRSPLCVMDLFLYSDGRSFKVTHVELRSRSVEQVQAPNCLASFGEQSKPPPTSG